MYGTAKEVRRTDTKKLEALAASVRLGSFTRAAEALGYTQSGLTHMMNALEKEMGFPVLLRDRAGVRLSAEGERVFPLVQECLAAAEALEREVALVNSRREESVRVAAYASIAIHWLPEVVQQFRSDHPDVSVHLQMGEVEEIYRWMRQGKVDMCFASRQEDVQAGWFHLKDDPLLVILPPDHELAGRTAIPVELFDGREMLMPSPGLYLDAMRAMRSHGVEPVVQQTQISDSAIISLVEHGLGVSVLSELVLRGRSSDVVALPMEPPAVRELGIAVPLKRELRPAVRQFIAAARRIIEKL